MKATIRIMLETTVTDRRDAEIVIRTAAKGARDALDTHRGTTIAGARAEWKELFVIDGADLEGV